MLQVNVARLHDDNREALSLAWVAGREGGTAVRREAAAAAALIGHLTLPHPNSIQVIGAYEAGIVGGFVERLLESHPAAVIVADGVAPPQALIDAAAHSGTPLFTSPLPAPQVIEKLARYLAKLLAETTERHGVFMDVLGLGVLIIGESGVGKSELGLELISRGRSPAAATPPSACRSPRNRRTSSASRCARSRSRWRPGATSPCWSRPRCATKSSSCAASTPPPSFSRGSASR